MNVVGRWALASAVVSVVFLDSGVAARVAAVDLSGAWEMNRDLSSAPGTGPGVSDDAGSPRPGGGRGAGGGSPRGPGGRGGGGAGGGGGFGGGRARGGPSAGVPSRETLEARAALMQEVMTLPARMTIAGDGDKVSFIEPDGVVRTYVASGATEKHQLTNGTVETKASWSGAALRIAITLGERLTVVRTFEVRDDPRRLEVATVVEGGRRDQPHLTVYDEVPRLP